MLRTALTGGIATGKSFCLDRFARLGVAVIDADLLARDAVAIGSPGLADVVRRFGDGVLDAEGSLDRPRLGRLVFSDPAARTALEAILHPLVYSRISDWFAGLPTTCPVAMADIPLLFETGRARDFARVVVCACEPAEQLRRLVRRDGLTTAEATARLAAQWPIEEKVKRGDFVIRTDGTFEDTERQVAAVFERLRAES